MNRSRFTELPKIELHCHLDGSVRPSTLFELSKKAGLTDANDLETLAKFIRVPASCESLVQYIECFKLPIALMQTTEELERIAYELMEDVAEDGVKYIEVRFAPHFHLSKGLSFEAVVESVLKGLQRGADTFEIDFGLILCCMRHMSLDTSIEVVEKGRPYLGKGVVAVDLAGDEHNYPPELHQAAFDLAKSYGYHITIHAGETGIAQNVITAIQSLHAERIGHGINIESHAPAFQLVLDTQTCLEMCPTSNLNTKAAANFETYPLLSFVDQGIKATINTDNRTVSNVTLTAEIENLAPYMSDFDSTYWQIYENAVNASFASSEVKAKLRKFMP